MIINYSESELEELARIMRSEALSDGDLGMLMVGNVVINRVLADCLTFKNIDSIHDAIYQPNQFSGTNNSLYYGKATSFEKKLAKRLLKGEYFWPASNALWFYAPGNKECKNKWYGQDLVGNFKSHCFYIPVEKECGRFH